ncbi:hypothetical protein U0070_021981, partial [Myodes glareolus]
HGKELLVFSEWGGLDPPVPFRSSLAETLSNHLSTQTADSWPEDCDECTWVARCAAWCLVCAHDTRVPGGGLEREPSQAELTQRKRNSCRIFQKGEELHRLHFSVTLLLLLRTQPQSPLLLSEDVSPTPPSFTFASTHAPPAPASLPSHIRFFSVQELPGYRQKTDARRLRVSGSRQQLGRGRKECEEAGGWWAIQVSERCVPVPGHLAGLGRAGREALNCAQERASSSPETSPTDT